MRFLRHESRSSFSNQDKRMSAADTTLLTRQREMLLQKLDEFERTNKALRRLLREQQATEVLQSNLILYNSRWGFCSLRRCCILRLLFSVCWLLFHLPFGCEAVAGVCYDSCKVEFPCCFRCSRYFFFVLFVFVPSELPLRPEPVKLNLVSVTEE